MKATTFHTDGVDSIHVTLSRRNLVTLLHGLESGDDVSCVCRNLESGERLIVCGEQDDRHYAGRPVGPGRMSDAAERAIVDHAAEHPNTRPSERAALRFDPVTRSYFSIEARAK